MASLQPLTGALGKQLAAHILRRCSYNITKERIDDFATKTAAQAVEDLFVIPDLTMAEPIDYDSGQPWINSGVEPLIGTTAQKRSIVGWWLNEALHDTSISHKMTLFLHQNFTTSVANFGRTRKFFDHISLLKMYAVGSYHKLAYKMSIDNLMLDYLDGESNTDDNPNENYAREFLELFTIGKGPQIGSGNYTNYTEDDIVEAAKLLSGWRESDREMILDPANVDPETGLTRGYPTLSRHEVTDKIFSAAFNGEIITGAYDAEDMFRELQDFVDMVFAQDATAITICRKLYRYFVRITITPEVETDIIEPMAAALRDNDYKLEFPLKLLLKSEHFFDKDDDTSGDQIIGGLIKSPVEHLLHTLSFFKIQIPDPILEARDHYYNFYKNSVIELILAGAGMNLFEPELVAGYPAYYQEPGYDQNWITANTISTRYAVPDMFITNRRVLTSGDLYAQIDMVDFLKNGDVISVELNALVVITEFTEYLFAHPTTESRYNYFLNEVFLEGAPAFDWTVDWAEYLNTGDDAAVRIPLENLFRALIHSQEFQLM